jgi:hypothetical protein
VPVSSPASRRSSAFLGRPQLPFWAVLAAATALALPAAAQLVLPGAQQPTPAGTAQRRPAAPRPAAPKPPSEDAAVGKDFLLNGVAGSLRIEKTGKESFGVRLRLEGTMLSSPGDACAIELGRDEPVPLKSLGRPAGLQRFQLEAPICPLLVDVLDDALVAVGPGQACVFQEADCRVDARGVWGPDAVRLAPQAKDIERARGRAETAVRDGVRQLLARVKGPETGTIAAEQAAFSSERETSCRNYTGENALGFCATKITEARAAALRARLAAMPVTPKTR